MTPYLHFFAKIFGHVKKKQYLCTRFLVKRTFYPPSRDVNSEAFQPER